LEDIDGDKQHFLCAGVLVPMSSRLGSLRHITGLQLDNLAIAKCHSVDALKRVYDGGAICVAVYANVAAGGDTQNAHSQLTTLHATNFWAKINELGLHGGEADITLRRCFLTGGFLSGNNKYGREQSARRSDAKHDETP